MNIRTSNDFVGVLGDHPWSSHYIVLGYRDGAISTIPHGFFRNWMDDDMQDAPYEFEIGRCSGLGVGSTVKYDAGIQKLVIGHCVAGGLRLRFLINGRHETRTISMTMFSQISSHRKIADPPLPQYSDTVIKNDVWIGDEAFILGGSVIETGCIIAARSTVPPNFSSEPYGVYAGSPARLHHFRFPERVRERLLELAWWEMPLDWIAANNEAFLADLTADEDRSLELLSELQAAKDRELPRESPASSNL